MLQTRTVAFAFVFLLATCVEGQAQRITPPNYWLSDWSAVLGANSTSQNYSKALGSPLSGSYSQPGASSTYDVNDSDGGNAMNVILTTNSNDESASASGSRTGVVLDPPGRTTSFMAKLTVRVDFFDMSGGGSTSHQAFGSVTIKEGAATRLTVSYEYDPIWGVLKIYENNAYVTSIPHTFHETITAHWLTSKGKTWTIEGNSHSNSADGAGRKLKTGISGKVEIF